jgi:hypothetical protein
MHYKLLNTLFIGVVCSLYGGTIHVCNNMAALLIDLNIKERHDNDYVKVGEETILSLLRASTFGRLGC